MDDKILSIFLKMTPDKGAEAQTSKAVQEIATAFGNLEKKAAELRKSLEEALKGGGDTAKLKADLDAVEKKLEQTRKKAKDAAKDAYMKQTEETVRKAQDSAERMERIGLRIGVAGVAILQGMSQAANAYVTAVNGADDTSAKWLETNDRLEAANQKFGKAAAKALQPWRDAWAGIAEKMADVAEQNPVIANMLAVGGGAMTLVGGALAGGAQVAKVAGDFKMLTAGLKMDAAATKMLTAAGIQTTAAQTNAAGILGTVGAFLKGFLGILGAGIAGFFAGDWISQLLGNMGLGEFLAKSLSLVVGEVVGLATGNQQAAREATLKTAQALGQLGDAAGYTSGQLKISKETMQSLSKTFLDYKKQEAEAQAQYEKDKAAAEKDYQNQSISRTAQFQKDQAAAEKSYLKDRQQAEADYQAEGQKALRDFATQNRQAEEDYYLERMNAVRDYNSQVQRAEEDFQREQARKREDFNMQVEDLVGSGDARGYEKARRAYELDRQRSQEDYATSSGRGSEDFNRSQGDRAQQFAQEQARKAQEFIQQQADRAQQFAQERADKAAEFVQQQKDREEQFKEEQATAKKEYEQRMVDLDQQLAEERTKRYNALVDMFKDELKLTDAKHQAEMAGIQGVIDGIVNSLPPGTVTQGSRASGGYVSAGAWQMHNGEFVLNARTTRAAEAAAGRKLDQQTMMGMLAGGGVTWNDQRRFDSRLSAQDRRQVMNDTLGVLAEAMHG